MIGSVLALVGLGALGAGGTALWYDLHRDGDYLVSTVETRHTDGYAVTSDRIQLGVPASGWQWTRDLIGTVRIRVTGTGAGAGTFVGIAPTDQADHYLDGVPQTVFTDLPGRRASAVAARWTGAEGPPERDFRLRWPAPSKRDAVGAKGLIRGGGQ